MRQTLEKLMVSQPFRVQMSKVIRYQFSVDTNSLKIQLENLNQGQVLEQRGSLIFFNTLPKITFNSGVLVDKQSIAIIAAVLDKVSLAVLLNQQETTDQSSVSIQQDNETQLYIHQTQVEQPITIENISLSKTDDQIPIAMHHYHRARGCSARQIITGNVFIDLFLPICYGQLILNTNEELLKHIPNQFDRVIVYTTANNQINRVLQNNQNTIFFHEDESLGSQYQLPKAALATAQRYALKGEKTLLIYTNLTEHQRAYNLVQEAILDQVYGKREIKTRQVLISPLFGEISNSCGYRQDESDLTVILMHKGQHEEEDILTKQLERELESLCSQDIPLKIETYHPPAPNNLMFQWPITFMVATRLHEIIQAFKEQKASYMEKQNLRIHIEPWDYYLYLDGKVWQNMLDLLNKLPHDQIDLIVVSWWVIRIVELEMAGYLKSNKLFQIKFKDEPKQLLDSLLSLSSQMEEFEKVSFKAFFKDRQSSMQNGKEFAVLISLQLNRLVELHILHLRMNDLLLPFKKDYFE